MDTFTQVALGVATSEVAFRRRLGKGANWLAAASALLPDLDFVLHPLDGEWSFITVHRGFSHSFAFCLAVSFPLAWAFRRAFTVRRAHGALPSTGSGPELAEGSLSKGKSEKSYWLFWGCSFASLFSHVLLDLCTSYGTRVLLPFSGRRCAWDFIGIIDLIYTSILAVALAGCIFARRRSRDEWAPWIAAAGLCLSTAYIGLGALGHARAVGLARGAAEEMGEPVRVEAFPMIGTVALWRVVAETDDEFLVGRVNVLRGGVPRLSRLASATGENVSKALSHRRVRQFREFTRGLMRPIAVDERTLEFDDMRYGFPADSPRSHWSVRVVFEGGEIARVSVVRWGLREMRERMRR